MPQTQQMCYARRREQPAVQKLAREAGLCTFEVKRSGSGHLVVRRGRAKSELPMHGGNKQLGTGLINKIKKDLGLR